MKYVNIFTVLFCTFFLSNCKKSSTTDVITTAPVPVVLPERTTAFDISYGTLHSSQKVDVYTPKAVAPFPVVVLIHGGGWVQGDKMEYRTSIKTEALLARGYAVVAVNYRLSNVAKFPAQIQDVKAAVRWIRANATTYNFNPNKIGAWGTSAGGHLTALLATSGGINALEDLTQGDATKSSTIQAAVDWFGPIFYKWMHKLLHKVVVPVLLYIMLQTLLNLILWDMPYKHNKVWYKLQTLLLMLLLTTLQCT
jgi:acetyl esterase/lipase